MTYHNFMPRLPERVVGKDGVVKEIPYVTPTSGPFDDFYEDVEVIFVPKPVEGSDEDYILVPKVKKTRRSVDEVINSQADDVGLDNMIRKFEMTGDPSVLPSRVEASDEVLDLTQVPQDSAEYFDYIHGLYDQYQSLPLALRQDMTMEEFVKKVSNDDILAYFKSIQPVQEVESEKDKKEGDK